MSKPRKPAVRRVNLPFVVGLLWMLLLALPLGAADMTADEQAVWKLEEQYWVYVAKSDLDGYLTLWDERFVGWPSFSPSPVGKGGIGSWVRPLHSDPEQKFEYTLEQKAVRSFGADVVAVHYLAKQRWVSVKTGQVTRSEWSRITHTWQKRGNTWVIITGMSSAQPVE